MNSTKLSRAPVVEGAMPYRDDQASLEARRDELRKDLAEATLQAEALTDAVRSRDALTQELAGLEERLRRVASRRLPLLDSIRIASPCSASWDHMVGDERVRFCGSCEKNVYNLSAMAGDEAEKLLATHEGSLCVRLYQRADGTVLTNDCPVGVRKKRVKRLLVVAAGTGALAAAAFAHQGMPARHAMGAVAVVQQADVSYADTPVTMGSVAPVPPPPPAPRTVEAAPVRPTHPPPQPPRMGRPRLGAL